MEVGTSPQQETQGKQEQHSIGEQPNVVASRSAIELMEAVEHGVNRELKFCRSLSQGQRLHIRHNATDEVLSQVYHGSTGKEIESVCRRIVRRLLKELSHKSPSDFEELEQKNELENHCNGQVPQSSFTPPPIRSRNRNWVEDAAIVRIERQDVLNRCAEHLGQTRWEWLQGYVFAVKKSGEARERMKFSRMRKRFQAL